MKPDPNGGLVPARRELASVCGEVESGRTFPIRVLQPDGRSTMVTALHKK